MPPRYASWLLAPFRTRVGAALAIVALAALVVGSWYGLTALRCHYDMEAAKQALADYDFPEASRRLDAYLGRRPDDPAALLLAAQATRRAGRLDDARAYLTRCSDLVETSTPEGRLQYTLLWVQQGEVKKHVHDLIDDVEIRHPASEQILEALALGCVHIYRLDEASFWTKQLLDRHPKNPIGRRLDARLHDALHRTARAAEIIAALLDDYPDDDKARLYLAGLWAKSHRFEEAAGLYRTLRRRRPDDLTPLLGLLSVDLKQERLDEVEPLLRELAERYPDNAAALLQRGQFALRQGRSTEAEPLLRRAVEQAPHDRDARLALATCLEHRGQPDAARAQLKRFHAIEAEMKKLQEAFEATIKTPAELTPRREAARVCLRNGQPSEALRWLLGVLDLAPDDREAHRLLAEYYETTGDTDRAAEHRGRAR